MTKTYNFHEECERWNAVAAAYHAWFSGVLTGKSPDMPVLPSEFSRFEDAAQALARAQQSHADVGILAPLFQDFITRLHKGVQEHLLESWGVDILTGLKNHDAMERDLAQEMARLARQGQAFSLALARIDSFPEIENALGRAQGDDVIRRVARCITESLRSFDTAYALERGYFVMILKQADILGGQKALERLRDALENAHIRIEISGEKKRLSMSCCVAEPLADDNFRSILADLRHDLDAQPHEEGALLTYVEMSPLQRFIQSGQKF